MSRSRYANRGYAQARALLEEAGCQRIGSIRVAGEGLTYKVYAADCVFPGAGGPKALLQLAVALRIPQGGCGRDQPDQARKERLLLEHLQTLDLPLRLPRPLAEIQVSTGLAVLQDHVGGWALETRAGKRPGPDPWAVIGEVAARCHGVPPDPLRAFLPGFPDRRSHAQARLAELERLDLPEARDALAWARDHLPPAAPSRLLHGDLLGQNLLVDPFWEEPPGVIDWSEAMLGDPAYDLAIVTRGVRNPFQVEGGLKKLLDAYNAHSDEPLTAAEVHLHELCLVAAWCREFAATGREGEAMTEQDRLRAVLGRASRAG